MASAQQGNGSWLFRISRFGQGIFTCGRTRLAWTLYDGAAAIARQAACVRCTIAVDSAKSHELRASYVTLPASRAFTLVQNPLQSEPWSHDHHHQNDNESPNVLLEALKKTRRRNEYLADENERLYQKLSNMKAISSRLDRERQQVKVEVRRAHREIEKLTVSMTSLQHKIALAERTCLDMKEEMTLGRAEVEKAQEQSKILEARIVSHADELSASLSREKNVRESYTSQLFLVNQALEDTKEAHRAREQDLSKSLSVAKGDLVALSGDYAMLHTIYRSFEAQTRKLECCRISVHNTKVTMGVPPMELIVLCVDVGQYAGSIFASINLTFKTILCHIMQRGRRVRVAMVVDGCLGSHNPHVVPAERPTFDAIKLLQGLRRGGPADYERSMSTALNLSLNEDASVKSVIIIGQSLYDASKMNLVRLCRGFRDRGVPVHTITMACASTADWVEESLKVSWLAEQTGGLKLLEGSYQGELSGVICQYGWD
ncbi:hypothetical protein F5Y15DRAFT_401453 [Xylariaceae sp. FL0016]|nr:hypothetical protein F5Y15DRAFT_401453 [Xylariaceae sp. FL0016]